MRLVSIGFSLLPRIISLSLPLFVSVYVFCVHGVNECGIRCWWWLTVIENCHERKQTEAHRATRRLFNNSLPFQIYLTFLVFHNWKSFCSFVLSLFWKAKAFCVLFIIFCSFHTFRFCGWCSRKCSWFLHICLLPHEISLQFSRMTTAFFFLPLLLLLLLLLSLCIHQWFESSSFRKQMFVLFKCLFLSLYLSLYLYLPISFSYFLSLSLCVSMCWFLVCVCINIFSSKWMNFGSVCAPLARKFVRVWMRHTTSWLQLIFQLLFASLEFNVKSVPLRLLHQLSTHVRKIERVRCWIRLAISIIYEVLFTSSYTIFFFAPLYMHHSIFISSF